MDTTKRTKVKSFYNPIFEIQRVHKVKESGTKPFIIFH